MEGFPDLSEISVDLEKAMIAIPNEDHWKYVILLNKRFPTVADLGTSNTRMIILFNQRLDVDFKIVPLDAGIVAKIKGVFVKVRDEHKNRAKNLFEYEQADMRYKMYIEDVDALARKAGIDPQAEKLSWRMRMGMLDEGES